MVENYKVIKVPTKQSLISTIKMALEEKRLSTMLLLPILLKTTE